MGFKTFFRIWGNHNKFCNLDFGIWVPAKAWAGPGSKPIEDNLELEGCAGRQRHTERQGLESWFLRKKKKLTCVFLQVENDTNK